MLLRLQQQQFLQYVQLLQKELCCRQTILHKLGFSKLNARAFPFFFGAVCRNLQLGISCCCVD